MYVQWHKCPIFCCQNTWECGNSIGTNPHQPQRQMEQGEQKYDQNKPITWYSTTYIPCMYVEQYKCAKSRFLFTYFAGIKIIICCLCNDLFGDDLYDLSILS